MANDYNTIEYQTDQRSLHIRRAGHQAAAGAPIDAVGRRRANAWPTTSPPPPFRGFIDDLASKTNLPVYITEYDINLADEHHAVAGDAEPVPTMFWNDANVKGITFWGYIEGATWETNTGLMTSSGTMRPAMTWLVSFLQTH